MNSITLDYELYKDGNTMNSSAVRLDRNYIEIKQRINGWLRANGHENGKNGKHVRPIDVFEGLDQEI